MTMLNNSCESLGIELKNSIQDSRTSWGYVSDNTYYIGGRGICFAGVMNHQGTGHKWQRFVSYCFGGMEHGLSRENKEKIPWSVYETYLYWLFNESIWRNAFLTKCPSKAREFGVWSDTCYRPQYILQAHMLARHPTFCPSRVLSWYHMKDHMDPHIALFLSSIYTSDSKGQLTKAATTNEHMGLMNDGSSNVLKAICTVKRISKAKSPHSLSVNRKYRGLNKFWSNRITTRANSTSPFNVTSFDFKNINRKNTLNVPYVMKTIPVKLVSSQLEYEVKKWMGI